MAVVEAVPAETIDAETASDDETEGMKDDDVMAPYVRRGNFRPADLRCYTMQTLLESKIIKKYPLFIK